MQGIQPSFQRVVVSLLLTALTGCTGKILGERNEAGASQPESPSAVDWAAESVTPGASYLRRLTNDEYNASVHDLLDQEGDVADLADAYDFVPDTRVHGFESNATNVNMSSAVLERYRVAAEAVASELVLDDDARQHVIGCQPNGDGDCAAEFIERFGRRAYRRPLIEAEIEQLRALAAGSDDELAGIELVIQHVLLSPNFLFRIEEGVADETRPELLRLTGYEIATRLSYLLLGTTPSPALLDAAAAGELDSAEGVAATAGAMLGDPRAREALRRFYDQWLRLDRVEGLTRDAEQFPDFDAELASSMREESNRLLDELIWEPGHSFLDLVSARHTFVDEKLGALYGVSSGSGWQRVELPSELGRAGLLGHAGLLAQTSRNDRVSPTLRGRYVREVLLCYPLPSLPANVPQLPDPVPGQSEQERIASHTSDPVCASCHELLDPLGTGLANFDAIGKFRSADEAGQPISAAGRIAGYSEELAFDGAIELGDSLRALPELAQCVVTQLFRHSFARLEQPADGGLLNQVLGRFSASQYSFQELVLALVTSDAFRYREPLAAQEGWE
jgi:hypothetical protein